MTGIGSVTLLGITYGHHVFDVHLIDCDAVGRPLASQLNIAPTIGAQMGPLFSKKTLGQPRLNSVETVPY